MKGRAISIKAKPEAAYSQVIFIMKDKKPAVIDFIKEAELIINGGGKKKEVELEKEEGVKKVVIKQSSMERLIWSWIALICSLGLIFAAIFISPFGEHLYRLVMGH